MNRLKEKIEEELANDIDVVAKMKLGSDEYKVTVDGVAKLADRLIEIEKMNQERDKNINAQEYEHNANVARLKHEKRDSIIKNCLTGASIVGGLGVTVWAYLSAMRYEDKGLIPTTEGGRAALKQLLKFKF